MSEKENTKLKNAIEANKVDEVLSLIDQKVVEANEAAMSAVELGNVAVLKAIKTKHAVTFNDEANSYMLSAAYHGHADVIKYLVNDGGCNVSDNQFGYSPVSAAASGGQKDIILLLRDLGANIRENEHNTLYVLAKDDKLETMQYLVEELGFDIHADEEVALRVASKEGHRRVVDYLESKGASLDNVGSICLALAVSNGHFPIAAHFVEKGVDWEFLEEEKDRLKQIADVIGDSDSPHARNLITHLVMDQLDS